MLVYGDRLRRIAVVPTLAEVAASGDFILASELAQGLVDAEFEARGADDLTPLHAAAIDMVRSCVRAAPDVRPLAALGLPEAVTGRTAEGYAFYAVYPEAWRTAARAAAWASPPLVIGVRSIGLGLAAMAAEGTGAETVVSLRPVGPPFRREVRVSEALKAHLQAHAGPFAIVDEGPGLSGSSFGAVLDLLEALGVERDRLVVLPSHAGDPGPEAQADHLARWRGLRRIAPEPAASPSTLFEDITGPAASVEDLSAGAWRAGRPLPAFPRLERRKVRFATASGVWLAKFAGLGEMGEAKLARGRALHAAGFIPEPVALRQGWLLSRWEAGSPARPSLEELARYLAFRAQAFPTRSQGASPAALAEMVRVNAGELGLGLEPSPPPDCGRPVHVDGRLHRWEWLRTPDGRLLKTDALDHSCGHDLIGCQDIAWDVAGASVELELDEARVERLREATGADPALLAFFRLAYPAFQAGLWTMAGEAEEAARHAAALEAAAGRITGAQEKSRAGDRRGKS